MKKIFYIVVIALVIAMFVGYKLYNKPHANLQTQKAEVTLSASKLFEVFDADEEKANTLYLNKVIEVNGDVVEIRNVEGNTQLVLACGSDLANVVCEMDQRYIDKLTNISPGQSVTIRGMCSGKLMDIVINQSVLIK